MKFNEGYLIHFDNIILFFANLWGEMLNLVEYQNKGHNLAYISGPGGFWKFLKIFFGRL